MVKRAASTSQDENQRVALAGTSLYRNANIDKDQRLINCFQESIKNELNSQVKSYVIKRPGLVEVYALGVGEGRGIFHFQGNTYSVVGNTLFKNTNNIQVLGTSTGPVGFIQFDNAGIQYLFLCDGTDGYQIDSTGAVLKVNVTYTAWQASHNYAIDEIVIPTVDNGFYYTVTTDSGSSSGTEPVWPTTVGATIVDGGITWTCTGGYGGFPSPHIPIPLFIDGYMVLPAVDSQDIYNSDTDNIFGWNAANFVTAEIFPDNVRALARQNNQFIAFGEWSSEFMFNAGIASGSPFARNEAAVLQMGIGAPYAIFQNEKFCMFVGESQSGGRAVWMVDGFNPKKISTEFVERVLDQEGDNLINALGYGFRAKGHLFYIVILSSTTIVYDLEEKVWHEWRSGEATFSQPFATDKGDGTNLLLDASTGQVNNFKQTIFDDDGSPIIMDVYTTKLDFNSMDRKFCDALTVVADQVVGNIQIRWSDDDYQTWSNWKTLDMAVRPFFTRLGYFRRRAFHLRYTEDTDCRLESIELKIRSGVN